MAKIGYQRVSSADQNLARQEDAFQSLGLEKVFSDKVSGKNTEREGLKAMMNYVRDGDTLYVESISRLARSTRDFLNIIDTLTNKGVSFVSQKESINTSTAQGRFILTVFAGLAELERESILQRQKEGIASAKQRGKNFGRPKAGYPAAWESIYSKWKHNEITAASAMKELKLTRTTFYKLVKQWESKVA